MPLISPQREQGAVTSEAADSQELPRKSLGGFRLLRRIGMGGMAAVYLGHRAGPTGASQFSAIKVMLPHLVADEAAVQMFLDEARVTSSVNHPNVCRGLDFGVDDGLPYLVTEYVVGEIFSDVIDALHSSEEGRAASHSVIAGVMAQACAGLHAAHEARDHEGNRLDIVHRDMAPQNIIVGYDGCVRVLDFGIARSKMQLHETAQDVLKGRLGYMAPEQMQLGQVDQRADVWSLGVMLWEGLAGRRLFKAASVNRTMRSVIADPLAPLLRSVDGLPLPLLAVIERSVVRDVRERFSSARQMSVELSRYTSTGAPEVAAWMQRAFAAPLKAKRRELQEAAAAVPLLSSGASSGPASFPSVVTRSGVRLLTDIDTSPRHAVSSPHAPTARWPLARRTLVAVSIAGAVTLGLLAVDRLWPSAETRSADQGVVAPTSQLGVVVVQTTGGPAHVQLDGRDLGLTPLRIALPPGSHQLRISRDGAGLPLLAPVEVQAGVSHILDIPFEQ